MHLSCDIVSKNVRNLEERVENDLESVKKELLFTLEFKYVINNKKDFIKQVLQDNKKLLISKNWGSQTAVNLVFCNVAYIKNKDDLEKAIKDAPREITTILANSVYDGEEKVTTKCISNNLKLLRSKGISVH